jgi:hypothetical protein
MSVSGDATRESVDLLAKRGFRNLARAARHPSNLVPVPGDADATLNSPYMTLTFRSTLP